MVRKSPAGDTRDAGSLPGLGRSPGVGNSNPLQYSCLEDSMDRGAWVLYSPWVCEESDTASTHSTAQQIVEKSWNTSQLPWQSFKISRTLSLLTCLEKNILKFSTMLCLCF